MNETRPTCGEGNRKQQHLWKNYATGLLQSQGLTKEHIRLILQGIISKGIMEYQVIKFKKPFWWHTIHLLFQHHTALSIFKGLPINRWEQEGLKLLRKQVYVFTVPFGSSYYQFLVHWIITKPGLSRVLCPSIHLEKKTWACTKAEVSLYPESWHPIEETHTYLTVLTHELHSHLAALSEDQSLWRTVQMSRNSLLMEGLSVWSKPHLQMYHLQLPALDSLRWTASLEQSIYTESMTVATFHLNSVMQHFPFYSHHLVTHLLSGHSKDSNLVSG